jgi:D-xylose transport system substrate-binding protein
MKFRLGLVVCSLVLSLLIGLTLRRGTGLAAAGPHRPVIGFSMDTLKEERWQRDKDLFTARVHELGADVLVQSANSDDVRQLKDVEALISNRVDALVIIPHDGAAMAKAVRLAHEAGIPVLSYDRLITGCDLDLYVAFDNLRVGELQAQYLADAFRGRHFRLVRIYGSKTDHNAFMFKEGQDKVLAPLLANGSVEVVHEDWADDWKPENAKKIMNAAITKAGRNFDAVLVSNDGTAGGCIQALLEEGLAGQIVVTGQDADLSACQRIARGTQAMTIYKPLKNLTRTAAEFAVKLARRQPIVARDEIDNGQVKVPAVLLTVVTVTKQNLDATVVADGVFTHDQVFQK